VQFVVSMHESGGNITIHTRKFHRVVLEDLDGACETPESFALKLSFATRTPIHRAKQIVNNRPHVLKANLTAAAANRLKSVIEDIGGKVRLETHLVTPGETIDRSPPDLRTAVSTTLGPLVCPSCGWEHKGGATHCSMCLRKFRDARRRRVALRERIPDTNPLESAGDAESTLPVNLTRYVKSHRLPVLAGIAAVLLLIIFLK
jgi:hypothetical protein